MKDKKQEVIKELVNLQYQVAGIDKTYDYAIQYPNWYSEDVIEQEVFVNEFKPKAIDILRSRLKITKKVAEREIDWFSLMYGLRFI